MWIDLNDWALIHNMEYSWMKNLFTKSEIAEVEMEKSKYHNTIGMIWMYVKQKNWTIYAWVYSRNSSGKCFYNNRETLLRIEKWKQTERYMYSIQRRRMFLRTKLS